jgi:hypothetical protein
MKERDREFFGPLWRRVLVTVLVAAWTAVEWYRGEAFWGMLTGAVLAYCVWAFFISWDRDAPTPTRDKDET